MELRQELEAAYNTAYEALARGDFDGFVASIYAPAGMGEGAREHFGEIADGLMRVIVELSDVAFVAAKAEGDLAGYYCVKREPNRATVLLTEFVRVEGRWRLALEGTIHSFPPTEGEDLVAKARELVDTVRGLRLTPRGAPTGPRGVPTNG
ncbi:MAG: hypothetical protein FJ291_31290 [Planctomycetes bacterium]|nr:hypothetical protein [Planctomycetota bacterium]